MAKVYIIWDNSNIHYGGLNQVFPIKEPGQQKEFYENFCFITFFVCRICSIALTITISRI